MARSTDPFTPRGPLGREQLERYAQGLLGPEERHEVELHLERDPLLRDALEGLQMPGALEAAKDLRLPRAGASHWLVRFSVTLLAVGVALFVLWPTGPQPAGPEATPAPADLHAPLASMDPAAVESTLQVVHRELEALPELLSAPDGPATVEENFRLDPSTTGPVERESLERIEVQPATIGNEPGPPTTMGTERHARGSRQLIFLHDLKLVHPAELAWPHNAVQGSPGRSADAEQVHRDRLPTEPTARPYLDLMDEAMGAFARGEYGRALDELYFILGQNPQDVNAQFYAGLACYRLRLYPRAAKLLRAAADNPVDSFREEANWYGALTLEQLEGRRAAKPTLERIAREGGFYAEQARGRLGR